MEQFLQKENAERRRKNFILTIIITIIVVYAAVPTYGIIRDVSAGEHVFVLTSDLPGVEIKRPVLGLFGKAYRFFFPQEEVNVPILHRIDLKGRVIYTDQTPYANGLIELRSEPRYTRTDNEGYFVFTDVDEGGHIISVLDDNGNVLARCTIKIDRVFEIEGAELIRLSDGTLVFQVAVHVKVLEITIYFNKGDDGRVTGIDRVELGVAPGGTPQPGEPVNPDDQNPPGPPTTPGYPVNPPVKPEPPVPPGGGGGGDGGGSEGPSTFDFDVLDTATATSYGTAGRPARVNIFGDNKRIAPGMMGSYRFTVDNTRNKYSSLYDVTFTAVDTLPDTHKIPMRYRLKKEGVYVAGDETTWCETVDELYQDTAVAGLGKVEYTLEWYWPEGDNDNSYAQLGGNSAYSYKLLITVTARAG